VRPLEVVKTACHEKRIIYLNPSDWFVMISVKGVADSEFRDLVDIVVSRGLLNEYGLAAYLYNEPVYISKAVPRGYSYEPPKEHLEPAPKIIIDRRFLRPFVPKSVWERIAEDDDFPS
jgi:hypothetical protein